MTNEYELREDNASSFLAGAEDDYGALSELNRGRAFNALVEFLKQEEGVTVRVVEPESSDSAKHGSSAAVLIPKTRYFVAVDPLTRDVIANAASCVAALLLLGQLNLVGLAVSMGMDAIVGLIRNYRRLSPKELQVVRAVLDLVRSRDLPEYAPNTAELAEQLDMEGQEVEKVLVALSRKPVPVVVHEDTGWRVVV